MKAEGVLRLTGLPLLMVTLAVALMVFDHRAQQLERIRGLLGAAARVLGVTMASETILPPLVRPRRRLARVEEVRLRHQAALRAARAALPMRRKSALRPDTRQRAATSSTAAMRLGSRSSKAISQEPALNSACILEGIELRARLHREALGHGREGESS